MRLSQPALFVLRGSAALTAFALMLGWPLAGAVIGALGIVNAGIIGWQLIGFGQLMHRIIDAVAKQARLMPLEPAAGARPERRKRMWGSAESADPSGASRLAAPADTPLARG
jgi:hypothetical protein